jgi:capsular exopolysaccharide synthesis family protein
MRSRLAYLVQFSELLASEEKQLERQAESLNVNQVNLEANRQADGPLEKVADQFAVEVQLLTLEMKAPPRVTKGEGPTVDWAAASGKRLKIIGMAGLAGLLLGMGLVTLVEVRNGRVDGIQGVVRGLRLPVVGQMPRLPAAAEQGRSLSDPSRVAQANQLVEALDVTRTRLIHAARADGPHMVLVTSAVAGEGKTTLACHLAASLARSGRRTLLLDADMRRPAVHTLFEVAAGPGFSELLQGQASPDDVVRQTVFPDLWLLTAGRWAPAAARALSQPRLQAVLDELRGRFDFVLVDSPPVLPIADALLLGARVDGVIFSVLQGVSQVQPLQHATARLTEVGARMLGVVLNGARLPRYGYSYGYSHEASRT